jgi:hypothetical protein
MREAPAGDEIMRSLFLSVSLLVCSSAAIVVTSTAFANPHTQRPTAPPPTASAQFDVREAWCEQYVDWLLSHEPKPALPTDVRPTHLFEIEFNSCKPNPQQYERETRQQADLSAPPNAVTPQTAPT